MTAIPDRHLEIVMMHRVLPDPAGAEGIYPLISIAPARLEAYLDRRASDHAFALPQLPQMVSEGRAGYALSFDDGYKDNLTHALPILERYNVPATIFVGTKFIDGTLEPFETWVCRLLAAAGPGAPAYDSIRAPFKRGSLASRQKRLEALARQCNVAVPRVQAGDFLSWDDVRELDRHPLVTIGSHISSHTVLTTLDPIHLWRELAGSKRILEEKLGRNVDVLSYPYGGHNALVRGTARLAGYKIACTTKAQHLSPNRFNPMAVPRFDLNDEAFVPESAMAKPANHVSSVGY